MKFLYEPSNFNARVLDWYFERLYTVIDVQEKIQVHEKLGTNFS